MPDVIGLIPARYNSTRLPGKPLKILDGLPMIIHTYKRTTLSKEIKFIAVCTDSLKIKKVIESYGGKSYLTSKKHKNGTERINEIANKINCKFVVDIQGDEPLIKPSDIDKVVRFHKKNHEFDIIVPYLLINTKTNEHIVKIISEKKGQVYFMSRYNVPCSFSSNNSFYKKHLSIISFKKKSLEKYCKLKQSFHEKIESIELLRAIENKMKVGTFEIKGNSYSVDVKEDLSKAAFDLINDSIRKLY
jgi:3-deoxy-manno-octulosonate cytidylyltransferase (CMP-KDO synthetase)